jgi:hypothetical protein
VQYYDKENNEEDLFENYLSDLKLDDISIELNNKIVPLTRDLICYSLFLKYNDIKPLESLTKVKPNECLIYTLVNIACNVVYILKLYNGEITDDNVDDIVSILLENCKVLYEKEIIFTSVKHALDEFFAAIFKTELKYQTETRKMIKEDVLKIFSNKFYLFETLIRLYEIIHKASSTSRQLVLAKNKILYLLSFIKQVKIEDNLINEIYNY